MKIVTEIDKLTYESSMKILNEIGIDANTLVKMCFKKLIKEGGIGFLVLNTVEKQNANLHTNFVMQSKKTKHFNKITKEMVDSIWNSFKTKIQEENVFDKKQNKIIKELSIKENLSTGISKNTARIYFIILFNLVIGIQNKRIIKIDDMKKYCSLIWNEFPEYRESIIKSLKESNIYWKKRNYGRFDIQISKLITKLTRNNLL